MIPQLKDHKNDWYMKSNCCNAPLITHSSDEGTGYYSCDKCGRPCDPHYVDWNHTSRKPDLTIKELSKIWKKITPTTKDKEQYKKNFGLDLGEIYVFNDKLWKKCMELLVGKNPS